MHVQIDQVVHLDGIPVFYRKASVEPLPVTSPASPALSVILPTYNRAAFLPQAFSSIDGQTFRDWELVVVDDGSTDGTRGIIESLPSPLGDRLRYVYQPNGGAYAARNTGLDHARGELIAFFDSDDEWLPYHLQDCWDALQRHADVHWVYGASRLVDDATGAELAPNSFYVDGRPRPFRRLRTHHRGALHVFDEPDLISRILGGAGLYAGLQNSVIRRGVFDRLRFHSEARNEAEDQVFLIRALFAGFRLAYFDRVHHVYHVHAANSSASARGLSMQRQARIYEDLIRGFEELPSLVPLTASQRRALNNKLAREYFWHLGYATYWKAGRRREAVRAYEQALKLAPLRLAYWKSYFAARLRMLLPETSAR
jgi:glycosyltransferase involved in cell wall biosynthesis